MKKFYSLITVALLGAVTTLGQLAKSPAHKNHATPSNELKVPAHSSSSARHTNQQNHTAAIIWSDDFSNASNWTITNDVGNSDDWVIGTGVPSGTYAIAG